MTEAYGYLRASGIGGELRDSFPRQRDAILKYASVNDIQIVDWFSDDGVPGKTEMQNRPGLGSLLSRLETSGVRTVIVEISDRLARDTVVNELIIREFQKLDCKVISASGGVDLTAGSDDNPTAKLVRQILAAVAEFDRCVTVLKLRAARERLRTKNGKCEGRLAYGAKNANEAATLALMLQYADSGYKSDLIAAKLNLAGIKTRYNKRWNAGTVWKIIERNRRCATE